MDDKKIPTSASISGDTKEILNNSMSDKKIDTNTSAKILKTDDNKDSTKESDIGDKIQKSGEKWSKFTLRNKRRIIVHFLIVCFVAIVYLSCALSHLYSAKKDDDHKWENWLLGNNDEIVAEIDERSVDATKVTVGTYFENIREINIKSSTFRVEMVVWFRWQGDENLDIANHIRVYKGTMNKYTITEEYSEGDIHYQRARMDVTINNTFDTTRFPLGSYRLKVYIEPTYSIDRVRFYSDDQSSINDNVDLAGYNVIRYDTGIFNIKYDTNYGNPELGDKNVINTEHLTRIEINREGMGTYAKCFIALIGTLTWIFIVLFVNTYHRVDPLGMIPAALFGTVTNIAVGANLLPDSLGLGLLEYVNMWGVLTILAAAITVINVNRIRNKWEDKYYASLYGKVMFYTILIFTLLGHISLPLVAYRFI